MDETTYYKLKKPAPDDFYNVQDFNANMDILDTELKEAQDKAGNPIMVNGHTVESNVPANAKFTDTTYGNASTTVAGLMSPTDKMKLNGVADNANNYVHPDTHPASMITGLPAIPTSLPANGGNADSIGGHPPSHFAQSAWYGVIDFTSATYPSPYIASSTNIPGFPDTDWFHVIYIPHTDPSGGYGAQIAIRFHGDNAFYIRSSGGTGWGPWRKMSSDYGTADLTAGVSALASGSLYFVYE